ncbi:MAG: hypothetical protein ABIH03_00395 [Pseudomonadota bacterium]
MAEKKETAAIKVTGSRNVRIENNVSVGFDHLADVQDSEGIKAKGNVALAAPSRPTTDPWYKRPVGIIGIGLFVAIVGGLVVARLIQWL